MPINQAGKGDLIRFRAETLQKLTVAAGCPFFGDEQAEEHG